MSNPKILMQSEYIICQVKVAKYIFKYPSRSVLLASLVLLLLLASPGQSAGIHDTAQNIKFYVSKNGNDAWSGRVDEPSANGTDGPFASIERARDEIRKFKKNGLFPAQGSVFVEFRAGEYGLKRTLILSAEDSGTRESPIVYSARKGEPVILTGGKVIAKFSPVTDPNILKRLDEPARGKVLQADLRALGITDFGKMGESAGIELYYHNTPLLLARWPNNGFLTIQDVIGNTPKNVRQFSGFQEGKILFKNDRIKRWLEEKDPWVHGYWYWDYTEEHQRIESIDPSQHLIVIAPPYHSNGYRKGQRFYVFNILAELDQPGEWYLDRNDGNVYFWPPDTTNGESPYVSNLPLLVSMDNVSYLTFQGIVFEGARGNAINISEGASNQIKGCIIRNIVGWAVTVTGGFNHTILGCDIFATGEGGIILQGGDRTSLVPGGHSAENNHIHTIGRWKRTNRPGILLLSVGNRVSHNLIEDAPHSAILFGGNDHIIEFNEIRNVCYETRDAGAIYTGRDWTMRGNIIRYNYLHNIHGYDGAGSVGVYLDDMFSSAEIFGNIFYDVMYAALIGGGRDNTIENNIFVNCRPAVTVDSRGLTWANDWTGTWIKEAREKGTLGGIHFDKLPYTQRYPALATILQDDPAAPKGNIITRNICVGGTWDEIDSKARASLKIEKNLIDNDPHFVDRIKLNFQLRDDSPAYQLGFKRIPIDQIGLYKNEFIPSWPVR